MSRYRRADMEGATYFFTVATYRRQPLLCDAAVRVAIRQAIEAVRVKRPFKIDAWVLLPDHLHCIWTLPTGDADYATRWSMIKRSVSLACRHNHKRPEWINPSKQKHRESTLWQRRYWEHRIRDDRDFERHADYIHYNPVRHGLCERVIDWPWSTFHRYVSRDDYPVDWGGGSVISEEGAFGE